MYKYLWIISVLLFLSVQTAKQDLNGHKSHQSINNLKTKNRAVVSGYPCPEDSVIAPCACTYNNVTFDMFMDCSLAVDETELQTALELDFPFHVFYELLVDHSTPPADAAFATLAPGVFGLNTFKFIEFNQASVETIQQNVFDGMEEELESIIITGAKLEQFYMNFVPFTQLVTIDLSDNKDLLHIYIDSPTVTEFSAPGGDFLYTDCTLNLQNAVTFNLGQNSLTNIVDLSYSTNLKSIDFKNNLLSALTTGDFCQNSTLTSIDLSNNDITIVEAGSLCVDPNGNPVIKLNNNKIKLLEESIWQDILPNVKTNGLLLNDNPLLCGCDVEWIFDPAAPLVDQIGPDVECSDGTNFHEIDPGVFTLCPQRLLDIGHEHH